MSLTQLKPIENEVTLPLRSQNSINLHDAVVSGEDENKRPFIPVAIERARSGEFTVSGEALTPHTANVYFASFVVFGCF
jgi:hypothetical protein